jgi:nucleoside-diphosphate-sugar epimerase
METSCVCHIGRCDYERCTVGKSKVAAMTGSQLHVVFGAGQVGRALVAHLAGDSKDVRVVSRHRPPGLPDDVDSRVVDVTNGEAAADAAKGASVVYQCLNAPYTDWPKQFPPLQRAVMAGAERSDALLVTLENIYGYGPTGGTPMTELTPLAPTSVKGRTRVAMTRELMSVSQAGRIRIAIGRASDFFGAGVTESTLGERVFAHAVADRHADFIGNPDLLHTYSYVPDIAAGLAILGTDPRAVGEVWHLPGPETLTTRAVLDLIAEQVGHPVPVRSVPHFVLRTLGLANPMMRGLAEMSYQFDQPFVLDTTKFESAFGAAGTPMNVAVNETVDWYRKQGSPR